jgi:TetR/AcrR family transcriptional regulator, transcriptional repressor for nem operon
MLGNIIFGISFMRISKEQAAENRRAIIDAAGRLFRAQGYDAVGLNELMSAAGFTRGGFYNHFSSKDDLAAEAYREIFDTYSNALQALFENADDASAVFTEIIDTYLSTVHRDDVGNSCPTVSLAHDSVRQGETVQKAFSHGLEQYVEVLGSQFVRVGADMSRARGDAIDLLVRLVGAVTLARAVVKSNREFSDEILETARAGILIRAPRLMLDLACNDASSNESR